MLADKHHTNFKKTNNISISQHALYSTRYAHVTWVKGVGGSFILVKGAHLKIVSPGLNKYFNCISE